MAENIAIKQWLPESNYFLVPLDRSPDPSQILFQFIDKQLAQSWSQLLNQTMILFDWDNYFFG